MTLSELERSRDDRNLVLQEVDPRHPLSGKSIQDTHSLGRSLAIQGSRSKTPILWGDPWRSKASILSAFPACAIHLGDEKWVSGTALGTALKSGRLELHYLTTDRRAGPALLSRLTLDWAGCALQTATIVIAAILLFRRWSR